MTESLDLVSLAAECWELLELAEKATAEPLSGNNATFIARARTAAPSIAEKCLRAIGEIAEMRAEIAERTRDHEALWAKFRERKADRVALLTVARAAKEMKEAGIATSRSMSAISQIWDALDTLPPHLLSEIKK